AAAKRPVETPWSVTDPDWYIAVFSGPPFRGSAGGQLADVLEFLSRELALRHGKSCLVVARINGDAFLPSFYCTILCSAQFVLTSNCELLATRCFLLTGA